MNAATIRCLKKPRPGSKGDRRSNRPGYTMIAAMAALFIMGLMAMSVVQFYQQSRRTLEQRHRGRQADYLARSGIEFAVSEILGGRDGPFNVRYRATISQQEVDHESEQLVVTKTLEEKVAEEREDAEKSGFIFRMIEELPPGSRIDLRVIPDEENPNLLRIRSEGVTAVQSKYSPHRETVRRYRVERDGEGKATSCVFVGAEY